MFLPRRHIHITPRMKKSQGFQLGVAFRRENSATARPLAIFMVRAFEYPIFIRFASRSTIILLEVENSITNCRQIFPSPTLAADRRCDDAVMAATFA